MFMLSAVHAIRLSSCQDAVYDSMLNTLLELDLALECSGFVGSIDSHWVR